MESTVTRGLTALLEGLADAIAERVAQRINAGVIPTPAGVGEVGPIGEKGPEGVAGEVASFDPNELDKAGAKYDPAIHSSSRSKNADGTWRQKRGLNKAGASTPPPTAPAAPTTPVPAPVPTPLPAVAGGDLFDLLGETPAPAVTETPATYDDVVKALQAFMAPAPNDARRRDAAFAVLAEFRTAEHAAQSAKTLDPAKYRPFLTRLAQVAAQ